LLIKYTIIICELFEILDKPEMAAKYLNQTSYEIVGAPLITGLFSEQAGL
jgi:hypothetical protein